MYTYIYIYKILKKYDLKKLKETKMCKLSLNPIKSEKIIFFLSKIRKCWLFSGNGGQDKNAMFSVLLFKEIIRQPDLCSLPRFRIQGGYSGRDGEAGWKFYQ